MRGRTWADSEREEIRRRRIAGEQWHVIGADYGVSGDAIRRAAGYGGFSTVDVGAQSRRDRNLDASVYNSPSHETQPTVKFSHGQEISRGQEIQADRLPAQRVVADPPRVPETPPAVHTPSRSSAGNFLCIPDPQIPFHKRDALQFIEQVRRHFSIPKENMLCAGDEVDQYFGSRFDHSPDATHTPNGEIAAALDELRRWYSMWPYMRLANSNHGQRWVKKALGAQIPSQLMRGYREVLQAPEGWRWQDSFTIDGGKSRFLLEHGHNGPQGFGGLRLRPLQNGLNTIWGHQHANAGIAHIVTTGQSVWGMCVGSLIDVESYAFEYDKGNQYKPWIGVGVVLNGGTTPLLVPYER